MTTPATAEVASALGRFFTGGSGPRHTDLSAVFGKSGYDEDDPYDPVLGTPSKEARVRAVVTSASRRTARARELIDGLLAEMRASGCFAPASPEFDANRVSVLQQAFRRAGWELSADGVLTFSGAIDLSTGGRAALDEQLGRLRRSSDDPALLIGTAKDLLESVAKFVLEELDFPYRDNADFAELWFHARDRLGIHPAQIDRNLAGGPQIQRLLQSAWTIAETINEMRAAQGTGHGRTLPTGISPEAAMFAVREACSMAEFTLAALDRALGR